jgi:MATE family multidrug resistance protein
VALNILLNWVFIYGNLGMPALGLTGAGWATLLARVAGVVAIYLWLAKAPEFKVAWPYGATKRARGWLEGLTRVRFATMARIGVPAAMMLMFEAGAFSMSAIMMGWLGAVPLAAHQIALSCAAFTFMFPLGLSMAVSMRIGKAVGEKRHEALRPIGFGALLMSCAFMAIFALVFAIAGRPLAAFFVHDEVVILLAAKLLVVAALFQLADGGQVIAAGALRGLSDVKVPAAITFIAYWILALPGAYFIGVRGPLGPMGVWTSLAVGLTFAAIFLSLRFRRLTRVGG